MKHVFILIIGLVLAVTLSATIPPYISYQGKLYNSSGEPLDTTVSVTFFIYDDSTDGELKWTEVNPSVTTINGLFTVLLGSYIPIPDSAFNQLDCFLGIQVGEGDEILPRKRLVSVPFANRVSTIDGASGGTIEGDVIIEGNINIEGDVIFVSDTIYVGDIQIAPTTRYYSISACDFTSNGIAYSYDGRWAWPLDDNNSYIYAPVNLPHGATVTMLVSYCHQGVGINFYRHNLSNDTPEGLINNIEYSDNDSIVVTSFSDPVIDNEKYAYAIFHHMYGFVTHGVRFEYTVESPLP